jgi:DNA modification methylase
MEVLEITIDKLTPYIRNPRKNDRAVNRMIASIKEFGFKIPLLVRNRGGEIEIVDGHLRVKAAKKLKMTAVPVIFCDEWSEAQVKAFRLLVNRSVNWASWDEELVALELADLNALDFDLSLTGFDPFEIDEFLFPDIAEPSAEETIVENPVSRLGDLWTFPSHSTDNPASPEAALTHRILAGDATSPDAVARLLGEDEPILLVTDPPYGVNYDPNWRERAGLGEQRQTGVVLNDDRVDWTEAYKLFPGNVAYVWHAGLHAPEVAAGLEAAGFRLRAQIVWRKQHFALSRGDFHWSHEPCWYAVRAGKSSNWCGDRTQTTVWDVPNLNPFGGSQEEPATGHSAQKPSALMRKSILNNTRIGDIVYDPFSGSGSVLIAAEHTDRICYGMELDPHYVDVIVRRWQDLTGKKAVLETDGRTFEQIAEERKQTQEVEPCPEKS